MKQQLRSILIPIALLNILLLLLIACSPVQESAIGSAYANINQDIDQSLQSTDQLIFAGKVADPTTGQWLNDYLVVVYLNGKEVGRFVSALDKFTGSGEGVHDGLFKVGFPNRYELSTETIYLRTDGSYLPISTHIGPLGQASYLYSWFDELAPGTLIRIQVPQKQIEYALKVFEQPVADLPAEMLVRNGTHLDANGQPWANALPTNSGIGGAEANEETAVATPTATPAHIAQAETETKWTRTLYDYSGNRWDVWQQFVRSTNPDMTWEQFNEQVTIHNPHLAADNYLFYPDKLYLLPDLN